MALFHGTELCTDRHLLLTASVTWRERKAGQHRRHQSGKRLSLPPALIKRSSRGNCFSFVPVGTIWTIIIKC